ncbi:MAG: solute-binding protein [Methanomicrobiales archaeon]|nr:solute-binding protein [Methanomicrobiales archaeon]
MTRMHVGFLSMALVLLLLAASFAGCTGQQTTTTPATAAATAAPTAAPTPAAEPQKELLIATTTSLYDTKLLDMLQPMFEKQYNVKLKITSQGTGKAIELAKKGDADVLLVHSPSQELAFVKDGYGINRRSFASNSFIIVGPENDPAGIKGMTPEKAFSTLLIKGTNKTAGVAFVSRGDGSGTHTAEKGVWSAAKFNYSTQVQKSGTWYVEAGKGMGETLQMANEKGAYVLTDEGTYLAYQKDLAIKPLITQGASLLNIYSVMTVYNDKQPADKIQMANNFVNFLIDPATQAEIGKFGVDKYGKALFIPMSVTVPDAKAGYVGDHTSPATDVKPPAAPAAAATAAAAATTAAAK